MLGTSYLLYEALPDYQAVQVLLIGEEILLDTILEAIRTTNIHSYSERTGLMEDLKKQ